MRRSIQMGAFLGALIIGLPAPSLRAQQTLPGWFRAGALFEGHGVQDSGSGWTIRIAVISRANAEIDYASIPCSGVLNLIEIKGDVLIFEEGITGNAENCISGGRVQLEQTGRSSLSYRWNHDDQTAEGTLAIRADVSG